MNHGIKYLRQDRWQTHHCKVQEINDTLRDIGTADVVQTPISLRTLSTRFDLRKVWNTAEQLNLQRTIVEVWENRNDFRVEIFTKE